MQYRVIRYYPRQLNNNDMATKKQLEGADFFTAPTPAPAEKPTPKSAASKAAQSIPPVEARHLAQRTGSVTTCFKIDAGLLAKLKALAYWDRRTNKDVLEAALQEYLEKYEAANGPLDVDIPRNLA